MTRLGGKNTSWQTERQIEVWSLRSRSQSFWFTVTTMLWKKIQWKPYKWSQHNYGSYIQKKYHKSQNNCHINIALRTEQSSTMRSLYFSDGFWTWAAPQGRVVFHSFHICDRKEMRRTTITHPIILKNSCSRPQSLSAPCYCYIYKHSRQ